MKITESPQDLERQALIQQVTLDAAAMLEIDLENDESQFIVTKVYDTIVDLVFERVTPVSEDENPHLLLGALWGAQMARQFNWYWADVVIDEQFNEVAMISPNQDMVIFPFSFTQACIDRQCICTILLAFNMLIENDKAGEFETGSYENIMLDIYHIIPPYELEATG